jgi:hypothetical protein
MKTQGTVLRQRLWSNLGRLGPPSQALAISLFTQDARTQDVPEDMGKCSSNEQMQEQI